MIVKDRVTSKTIDILNIDCLIDFGRYFIISTDENICVNDNYDLKSSFFVPARDMIAIIGDEKIKKKFNKTTLLSNEKPLLNNTFNEIYNEIKKNNSCNNISALYRNIDDKLNITEKDRFIKDNLYHLEEICRDPAYKLDREVIKVPIARAKRIPQHAINYLASHTEDWSRRRISGVEPKRIKSEIFNYNLKIYENKMTVFLIDKLLEYCNSRLRETKDTEEYLQEIEKIIESKKNHKAWYKKLDRDYLKLGSAIDIASNSNEPLIKLKKYIHNIQSRLYTLLSTDIYRANKSISSMDMNIKRTNLLDNHQHYRYLVRYLDKTFDKHKKDNIEISNENNELCNAFIEFSWLLIYRSLIQIGFNIDYEVNDEIKFHNSKFKISVTIKKTDIQNIKLIYNNKSIEFIPLPYENTAIKELLFNSNTYLLTLDNDKLQANNNIIQISPAKINSEERVTKVIFKAILKEYIDDYYMNFDFSLLSQQQLVILLKWIKNENTLFQQDSNTSVRIKSFITIQKEQELLSSIASQKNNLSLNKKLKIKQLEAIEEFQNNLFATKNHFKKYFTCISCGSILSENILMLNHSDQYEYKCKNKDCGVHYGCKIINNQKEYFYYVKNYQEILNHNDNIENAFGYECINNIISSTKKKPK